MLGRLDLVGSFRARKLDHLQEVFEAVWIHVQFLHLVHVAAHYAPRVGAFVADAIGTILGDLTENAKICMETQQCRPRVAM